MGDGLSMMYQQIRTPPGESSSAWGPHCESMHDYGICWETFPKRKNANAHLDIQMGTMSVAPETHYRERVFYSRGSNIIFQVDAWVIQILFSTLSLES